MPDKPQSGNDDPKAKLTAASIDPASVAAFLELLRNAGPIPFTFTSAPPDVERGLKSSLNDRLVGLVPVPPSHTCTKPVTAAFPPAADVLLSLIRPDDGDEITGFFRDYFRFCDHTVLADAARLEEVVDGKLLNCTSKFLNNAGGSSCADIIIEAAPPSNTACTGYPFIQQWPPRWPSPWAFPPTCLTLWGERHLYRDGKTPPGGVLRRLFIADLAWLFYMARMGIFQILGRILDDFAYSGRFPISNGSVQPGVRDDVVAVVLEAMSRQMETGTSSKVRDRATAYRRCLGWVSDAGRKLDLDTSVCTSCDTLLNRFIADASLFYRDKQLATAIRDVAAPPARASGTTLVNISDTLDLLKKSFDAFDYGRNYNIALSGIVWVVAGMTVIRELRSTFGIPPEFEQPYEFIPAAYDILVMKRPITPGDSNRYLIHRECANDIRDILLDIAVLNHQDVSVGGELDTWLNVIEGKVEGYRTAYRALTGIDLANRDARSEQKV